MRLAILGQLMARLSSEELREDSRTQRMPVKDRNYVLMTKGIWNFDKIITTFVPTVTNSTHVVI